MNPLESHWPEAGGQEGLEEKNHRGTENTEKTEGGNHRAWKPADRLLLTTPGRNLLEILRIMRRSSEG
jgi:hypothetical protein